MHMDGQLYFPLDVVLHQDDAEQQPDVSMFLLAGAEGSLAT